MPRAVQDFSPIDASPYAVETFTFDFGPITVGETIITVSPWSLVALNSLDSSPTSRIIGSAQLNGAKVLQKIGNCVAGEDYEVISTVITSAGQTLTLYANCPCRAIT